MSSGAYFKMKTIARDLSAEQAIHKMLALQKSAQFSEVRVLPMSNSKTRFMIGGYRWPSRQARRRYGVGKTKNPSSSVPPLFGGPLDRWELPTANPGKQPYLQMTPALARAIKLSRRFHHFDPRTVSKFEIDWPKALTCIGAGVRIDYLCDKFDGKPRVYFHEFEKLATVYVGDKPQPDGTNLLIIKGKFRITQNGIEG